MSRKKITSKQTKKKNIYIYIYIWAPDEKEAIQKKKE